MPKIVIIGGGLTGISAAYHLEKRGFYDYLMVEKDATLGGLCRSVQQDGFTFDYTGHLLHAQNPYFQSLIASVVGMEHLNNIDRRSFIYSQNIFTKYPYQINLYGLPTATIADCIKGYVLRKKSRKKNQSFYDWVLEHFGSGFAQHFFFPFQSKIFDYDLKKVTATWMGRFVPDTSLEQMIEGALNKSQDKIGYNAQFFYPKQGGIQFWIDKLASEIKNTPYTGCAVKTIDIQEKRVFFEDGTDESYEILINTMPLDHLLKSVTGSSRMHFKATANKLLCNSVVNFNIGCNHPELSEKHWIYFPESQYPFYRLGFPHNFAPSMAPAGCSSLYGEFSYVKKTADYVQQKLSLARRTTKKLLNIDDKNIITEKIIHIPRAYVLYDFWREQNLEKLLATLTEYGIHSIGRYGAWKYSSMQEAVLDGKKVAEQLTIMPARQTYYKPEILPSTEKQKEL